MQFKDPERQKRFEALNSEGLSLKSLIENFNAARLMLSEVLAAGPADNPMQWTEKVVAMEAQLSRAGDNLLKTAERLNLVVNKETLRRVTQAMVVEISDTVRRYAGSDEVNNQIVDDLAPRLMKIIADAVN